MTIDINKPRRLAQAATPGPWYATGKLTRYVEARIDGGLIQEVAACGPTKADGGYGPQQEANARLIAAANPATISELLDRLEAAEKAVTEAYQCGYSTGREEIEAERDALRAELSKQQTLTVAAQHIAEVAQRRANQLQAKIERMEKQEPVAWLHESRRDSDVVTDAVKHVWGKVAVGSMAAYSIPLYALPGAQPAPSVPLDSIGKLLTQAMDVAVANGANSVSMPDELVEVAAWLAAAPKPEAKP